MATLKALIVALNCFALVAYVRSESLYSTEDRILEDEEPVEEDKSERNDRQVGERGHHGHAHSYYHHFSGPVKGHHQEVIWEDKHGHHHHDYKAHPHYKYSYDIEDHHTKDHHGQKEHRDGKDVDGEYHLHEPGGNVRSVKYHASHHGGFFAEVHNYGGIDHSAGHGR